jgi:ankyrin repeat/SOCS box protein 8
LAVNWLLNFTFFFFNLKTEVTELPFFIPLCCVIFFFIHYYFYFFICQVDAMDYNLDTPLSWAARRGNLGVIQVLLEYNADASLRNAKGHTPLMRAAAIVASGLETAVDDACLELLIRATGRIEARCKQTGQLVQDLARDNKVREMLLPLCSNPLQLKQLCRDRIRRCLGSCFLPNVVPELPIPQQLQSFVLLQK